MRIAALLSGVWAGVLLAIALAAAPTAFALLGRADAGRVAGQLFTVEAYAALAFAIVLYPLLRRQARAAAAQGRGSAVSAGMLLVLGTLFCTVAGHFALRPMMDAARLGGGGPSFANLHAASLALYALKTLLVLALAWRLGGERT